MGPVPGKLLFSHLGGTAELPVAAENAEAPGLIKVVINVHVEPFHLQRLSSR